MSNKQPLHPNSFNTNTPVHNGQYTYAQITKNNQTTVSEQPTLAEQLASFLNEFKAMFSQLTYLLTYLLTYSMVQSPSWEANRVCS